MTIPAPSAAASKRARPVRLGRGLASLLGDRSLGKNAGPSVPENPEPAPVKAAQAPEGVYTVEIRRVAPSRFQPRRNMNPQALEDLAGSLRENGMLQPILVRPHPDRQDAYQIIGGERRWRAAQIAGLERVPVHVRHFDDREAAAAALVENLQRNDLNAVEEAEGLQTLQNDHALNQESLARLVGKSRSHIANTLRLLKAPVEIRAKLMSGDISAGHARALLSHPEPVKALEAVLNGGLNVRQAEELARTGALASKRPAKARPSIAALDARTRAMSGRIERALKAKTLGIKVQMKLAADDSGKGSMRVSWKDAKQFEALLKALNDAGAESGNDIDDNG